MRLPHILLALLLLALATGCPPSLDDDDATANDDDATANDDDATADDDDDATADDDDATMDDDDATADDDDATMDDDDATADDDDATMDDDDSASSGCDPTLQWALIDFATWNGVSACGDAFLSIGNADSSARIAVSVDTSSLSLSPNQTWTLDVAGLTQPPNLLTGWVSAQRGAYLQSQDCVGAPPIDTPAVDRSFTATGGFVLFTILTTDGNSGFTADVSLQDLVVTADDDAATTCVVPDRALSNLGFGYWPG